MERHFKSSITIIDGEKYEIKGMNIWDFNWQNTGDYVNINDPLYNQAYTFRVYEIKSGESSALFAAGEFSNCVWGIYEIV